MQLERYPILQAADNPHLFVFVSHGSKGAIQKAVVFSETQVPHFYNLGFGDYDPITNEINDLAVTDNKDTQLVLHTLAAIVLAFTEQRPEAKIFATGSTPARTRLYRMSLTMNLDLLEPLFELYGYREGNWETFVSGHDYEAFYVVRKR